MVQKLVGWDKSYSLNMPELDAQHKTLFDLINKLWEAVVHDADKAALLKIVEQLEFYTISHFTAEEVYMRAIEYPDLDTHRVSHASFVDRIAQEKATLQGKNATISLDLIHFLNDWLIHHIKGEDRIYADHAARRAQPTLLGRFFKLFS